MVTNVLGGPSEGVHAEIHKVNLAQDDLLLLCTDGLSEAVDDAGIAQILSAHDDPEEACHHLVEAALQAGGRDNITVIVAHYHVK